MALPMTTRCLKSNCEIEKGQFELESVTRGSFCRDFECSLQGCAGDPEPDKGGWFHRVRFRRKQFRVAARLLMPRRCPPRRRLKEVCGTIAPVVLS